MECMFLSRYLQFIEYFMICFGILPVTYYDCFLNLVNSFNFNIFNILCMIQQCIRLAERWIYWFFNDVFFYKAKICYCNIYIIIFIILYNNYFIDDGHSFDQVIFYGNECTLVIFDLMMLSFFYVLTENILLAGIITGFLIKVCNHSNYA